MDILMAKYIALLTAATLQLLLNIEKTGLLFTVTSSDISNITMLKIKNFQGFMYIYSSTFYHITHFITKYVLNNVHKL